MNPAKANAFAQSMLPHLDAAFNLARWLSGNDADADDVVQESYLRAFRYFDSFNGDNPRAWLLTTVRNTWYAQWNRQYRNGRYQPYDDAVLLEDESVPGWEDRGADDPEKIALRREDSELVHRALASLSVEYREVLVLRELEDLSYRDVAMIAGIPIGTVMSRLSRARRMLAQAVRQTVAPAGAPAPPATAAASSEAPTAAPETGVPTHTGNATGSGLRLARSSKEAEN